MNEVKKQLNIVYLNLQTNALNITSAMINQYLKIGTLSVGYRPTEFVHFTVENASTAQTVGTGYINTNGSVYIWINAELSNASLNFNKTFIV